MVANKHITKFIIAVMAVAVVLCLIAVAFSNGLTEALGGTGVSMEYETKLFNTDEIIEIDIKMDQEQWDKMLADATSEEYYSCDVVINGKTIKNVGIRPKGNTSLSSIAMNPDTDRFSLKLEFDQYVENQTCYGLDKLILNNNYADATNMKEAVIYDMFQYLGADASLYNYAKVSVNGEYWGVYLALEAVEDSFMLRNYGTQDGELYKPDTLEMGGGNSSKSSSSSSDGGFSFNPSDMFPGNGEGFDPSNMPQGGGSFDPSSMPTGNGGGFDPSNMPQGGGNFDPSNMPQGGGNFDPSNMPQGGGFSNSGGGANLNYTDDELDSYSTIWDAEITKTTKKDHRRVVTALKNISEGTDLETYLDVDNVLKYMAVHTFSVNMDSLSGSMSHNYYLYEYDGQLNMIPWDYNLALGGMSMGNSGGASEMINDAIDTPFAGTHFFDALLENEEYLAKYHEYLQQLVDEYINGGRFDEVYSDTRAKIDSLVETDPTAFYTYDEYLVAAQMLYDTVKLRGESIKGQLDGTIPSTDAGQRADSSSFVDASGIDISAMGQFSMGGMGGGGFSFGGMDFSGFGRGDSFDSSVTPDATSSATPTTRTETLSGKQADASAKTTSGSSVSSRPSSGDRSGFSFSGGMPSEMMGQQGTGRVKNIIMYGICAVIMAASFVGVRFYKRRRRINS